MMRLKILVVSMILSLVFSLVPPSQQVSAASFSVNYTLTLEQEDCPEVTIKVNGYPNQNAVFAFLGSAIDNISSLRSIFQDMEVKDLAGNDLPWQWGNKGISVTNGNIQDFTIHYAIDAINYQPEQTSLHADQKIVLFRFRRIFFIAGDVFLTPKLEPENMTVDYSLPEGTTLYASLPSENETFQAVSDYWGNLQADFSMAYFAGGHALFTLSHTTEWGDEYQYVWFDRDPLLEAWTPLYGNTPWEQAELYMESAESCASYFRDAIGKLPNHRVLFTNVTPQYSSFPSAGTNQDWYHSMQIWPRFSEPETCHHIFHQYSFSFVEQSKLVFSGDSIGKMLNEGLPTYYEQILPSLLLEDPRYSGKLFEFYALDIRGIPFGIRGNIDNHVKYNLSALKVYLLDQYIRSVTDGADSLDGFVKAMWEMVKDNQTPERISQADVVSAFSSVVGVENAGYLNKVANMSTFDLEELEDLRAPFSAYADWMIQKYFWGKPILFYMYLDIVAAKGNEWPHFATYPHNVGRYRSEALSPVWDGLSATNKALITQEDILNSMQAATGKNHAGFFEFWESLGVTLDLNEIKDLASWDPNARTLEDSLPFHISSIGTLKSEHLLSGVAQLATIKLDTPVSNNKIFIDFQFSTVGENISTDEVSKIIQGDNVAVISTMQFSDSDIKETLVLFSVTTEDPALQEFPITLTYPLEEGVSRFAIELAPFENQIGDLYYLGPIDPILFDLVIKDDVVLLPETSLEGETYLVTSGEEAVQYKPGDSFQLSNSSGSIDVQLLDQYGFLRGLNSEILVYLPPTASFSFSPSDPETPTQIQFNDASNDPNGQIEAWVWDFGDGQTSQEKSPLHTYAQAGRYSVSLTVTDGFSATDTQTKKIRVGEEHQNMIQNEGDLLKLFLIGGGILLAGGLVFIFLFYRKKRVTQKS